MRRRKRSYARRATRSFGGYARSRVSRSGIKSAIQPIIAGILTGVIQSFVPNDLLGGYADTAVPLSVGYFLNDKTLMTLGAYEFGIKLASNIGPAGSIGTSKGVY